MKPSPEFKEDSAKPKLVVCCGMRRSGSTLQFNLARAVVSKRHEADVLGYLDGVALRDLVHSFPSDGPQDRVMLVKCHDVEQCREFESSNILLLYTFRDFRDIYVSGKIKLGWHEEMLGQLTHEARSSFLAAKSCKKILKQKYESLFLNKQNGVREIANFLGIELTDAEITSIASNADSSVTHSRFQSSYVALRDLARSLAASSSLLSKILNPLRKLNLLFFNRFGIDPKTQVHIDHVSRNKGKPGAWRKELSDSEKSKITTEHADLLAEMGYSNEQ